MKKRNHIIIPIIASLMFLSFSRPIYCADEPRRVDGLSVHMTPKRVAQLDEKKRVKWGFMVSQLKDLKPSAERPVFQAPEELFKYFRGLSPAIRENGIWVITSHPDAYSADEKSSLEMLKTICKNEAIPLFMCRGRDIPDGWERLN
jgi:hypothetical protein